MLAAERARQLARGAKARGWSGEVREHVKEAVLSFIAERKIETADQYASANRRRAKGGTPGG
jgi:hypothetical protein